MALLRGRSIILSKPLVKSSSANTLVITIDDDDVVGHQQGRGEMMTFEVNPVGSAPIMSVPMEPVLTRTEDGRIRASSPDVGAVRFSIVADDEDDARRKFADAMQSWLQISRPSRVGGSEHQR